MSPNETNKAIATEFLRLVIAGQIAEAYQSYVDMSGEHHNIFYPAGFPSLQRAMAENEVQFPGKQWRVAHVLGDGDLVAVHSHLILKTGTPGLVVVHLFRMANTKIVEMWDCGQLIPDSCPNTAGAF